MVETTFATSPPPSVNDEIIESARAFRIGSLANGYKLARVEKGGKRPVASKWQFGESADALMRGEPANSNTGLILDGLRAVDIDVDDEDVVQRLLQLQSEHLPKGGLVRYREGSSRRAILYRAAVGAPGKRVADLDAGKVEILGAGQQLVVQGSHPSGALLRWADDRSPATVNIEQLASVSEEQIAAFLDAAFTSQGKILDRRQGGMDRSRSGQDRLFLNQDLVGGLEAPRWFDVLEPGSKKAAVAECLEALDNRSQDPRQRWLKVLFGVADAGRLGCPDARELALQWSRVGLGWTSEADFEAAWSSARSGGASVGSLLYMAQAAGANLDHWRNGWASALGAPSAAPTIASASIPLKVSGARHIAQLPLIPQKRPWLHGNDLVRGAVSLLVAPGGRGKSSWLIALSLACASGRSLLGSHVFGGPLKVLYINAEDRLHELTLRLRAAMQYHGLTDVDLPGLFIAGADNLELTLIKVDRSAPALDPAGWQTLEGQVAACRPDIVVLDPLVALTGGATLNDNAAAALLMRGLVSLAAKYNLAVMIAHHTAKNRDLGSADAAMGAASIVNLARISLALEPLTENDAGKIGVAPWDAKSIFRVTGTKMNLAPASSSDRWFRLISVEMPNAAPPIYPNGDAVGVVEVFKPSGTTSPFSQAMLDAVVNVIRAASPSLSPSAKSTEYAVPKVAQAISPFRGGRASDGEAKAILDYLTRTSRVVITKTKVERSGRGAYERQSYAVVGQSDAPPVSGSP